MALQLTIDAEKQQLQVRGKPDIWLDITGADFIFLTESSEGRITSEYAAALEGAPASCYEAVQRQLMIFRQLDILNKNAEAGLSIIPPQHALISPHSHYLLFTGHMIDKPGRMEPRFPASMEAAARQKIKEYILDEMKDDTKIFKGIAGGACGGTSFFMKFARNYAFLPNSTWLCRERNSSKPLSNLPGPIGPTVLIAFLLPYRIILYVTHRRCPGGWKKERLQHLGKK